MPKRPDLPVYFTKLVLENIRSFGKRQELKLVNDDGRPARWTLIVGNNNVGKTTLLQCLSRMRPVFNDPSDNESDQSSKPVEPELAREESNDVLDALARSGSDVKARLEAGFSNFPLEGSKKRQEGTISTSLEFRRTKDDITYFKPSGESSRCVKEPLVLAYGAGRHPRDTNVNKVSTIDLIKDSTESLFKDTAELYDAEALLYHLDYSALRKRPGTKGLLDRLKNMLSVMLPDIRRPQDIKILGPPSPGYPSNQTGVHVKTPSGDVPLVQLSLGYRMVFAWMVDMAWQLLTHHPAALNPLAEPAIVIVDEIDLHLHPRWQREIREHLTNHFPKVQFIATAHSPVMAQSSLGANLAVVRWLDDHAVIENDPVAIRDWRLDQISTSRLFGLESSRSPDVEKLQKRRRELVLKGRLSVAESKELADLDHRILGLPTAESFEDQKAMDIIRQAAERLQSSRSSS